MPEVVISNITYVNTLPFRKGLASYQFPEEFRVEIREETPARCAENLKNGSSDLGIVPVAAIREMQDIEIVSDFCIASQKEVRSVMLFSEVPLQDISSVYLDYQSRTSVKLLQYLAREKWKKDFHWLAAGPGYENNIKGTTAGLIIGDRALAMYDRFPYRYDMASEWHELTSLPFVFAVWAGKKNLPETFVTHFNHALSAGISSLKTDAIKEQPAYPFDIVNYLQNNIYYSFDTNCKKAVSLFMQKAL